VTLLEVDQHVVHREQPLAPPEAEQHVVRREHPVAVLEAEQHAVRRQHPVTPPEVEQHAVLRRIRKVAPLKVELLILRAEYDQMFLVQELRQLEERVAGQLDVTLLRGGWGRVDDLDSHRVVASQAKAI
jgi:hypothetical protein